MIVVDTNLIAYLLLEGERTAQAEKVLLADGEWAAPSLWRSEFRNVLAVYLHREAISLDVALKIAEEAEFLMEGKEYEISSSEVLNLVTESHCSAYDCEFIALAQSFRVPLVTSDKRILSEFPKTAVSLESFVS
jgi:predicted nucleic acid-binding protein